ncbi:RNA-binding protein NOB1 [Thelohanellus kitauei]|uniref:RNA-binding protein NOB1 n=1 Tax=Thelohanellus kitauei TaxID=669202 RepID=A0A0C2ICA8_THEKT|nr:RNA-binding protein NOB1 [Thelohanellus kitauei]
MASDDRAIQNTCLHLGISVISSEGFFVKTMTNYVFVCSNCYRIYQDDSRTFCSFCGYQSLVKSKRTVDEDGSVTIETPKSFHRFKKEETSWMSSIQSLRKHGGAVVNEEQLMKLNKKNFTKTPKISKITDLDGNPFQIFSARDTNSRSFQHGYHLRKKKQK